MRYIFTIFFVIARLLAEAQIIVTFAGGGTSGLGDGGPATIAQLADPGGCVFSKNGDLFVASGTGNRIRRIAADGTISTIAGNGSGGYTGDGGPATDAKINFPVGITLDTVGNIFFSDGLNHAIRKIDIFTGIITTICGTGVYGYSGDGEAATLAQLRSPNQICFDRGGNLYIADADNNRVRKVSVGGIITTYAGTGVAGFSGDGDYATSAKIYEPTGVACDDSGNLFIADDGNYRIRKVNSSGVISTYAGNGSYFYIGDNIPATNAQIAPDYLQFDYTFNLYFSSSSSSSDNNVRVYKIGRDKVIHAIAGNGILEYCCDGGPATAAGIYEPSGLAFDTCGNLYIGDVNSNRVRKVLFNPYCWPTEAPTVAIKDISIYPNPITDELHLNNMAASVQYILLTITGIIKQSGTLNKGNNTLSLSSLPPGLYLLELVSEEGQRQVKKIIKE